MNKQQKDTIKEMQGNLPHATHFDRNGSRDFMECLCGIVNSGLANVTYQDKESFKLKLTLSGKEHANPYYHYTLYAKYVPTQDSYLLNWMKREPMTLRHPYNDDVRVSRDKEGKDIVFCIPWHKDSKPTKRNKYIMYNCFKYKLVWL